jgi:flagellar biogenesis protein FliO
MTFQNKKEGGNASTPPPDGGNKRVLPFLLLSLGGLIVIAWVLFLGWLLLRLAGVV